MPTAIYTADAFTDSAFAGNPAAVCLLDRPASESWMQNVASEMNLSETAFPVPMSQQNVFGLRWFTPSVEVALCGHATLATAHILWSQKLADAGSALRFETLSGVLTAARTSDGWIELDFPALDQHAAAPSMELTVALGAEPVYMGRSKMDILCELESEQAVRELAPDFANLAKVPGARGIIVTARADEGRAYDFVSRFFVPSVGVDEDPVTGSSHCALAPFWASRLGKSELTGYQASSRGGFVCVAVEGDRVKLRGQAVTILKGELQFDAEASEDD